MQHSLHCSCFARNEDLADSGSVCDTLQLAIKNEFSEKNKAAIRINPNPVQDFFYINYDLPIRDNALFVLYDNFGKEVLRRNLYGTMKTLLVHDLELNNGVYFYSVQVRGKTIGTGKIAIINN